MEIAANIFDSRRRWTLWLYEGCLGGLALLTVWLLTLLDDLAWVETSHQAILMIFVVDYVARLILAPDRSVFVRSNVLDLIAILPLDFLRVARLARLLRLIRLFALVLRFNRTARVLLGTNGLGNALLFTLALVGMSGMGIWAVEPKIETVADGLWWSVVTVTTVGYGDISPSTPAGRAIAVVLMVVGIGTMGMVTASLTAYFMGHHRPRNATIDHIRSQLDQWDDLPDDERQRLATVLRALADKRD